MKLSWTVVAALATRSLMASPLAGGADEPATTGWNDAVENIVLDRLERLDLPLTDYPEEEVLAQVRMYVTNGRHGADDILGRAATYFPVIEHYLRRYDLPEFLKYLPIVESGMRPTVTSPVGAAGLWQFMPATAREYGLTINAAVDERRDPYRSSEAAARLLSDLYERFGDWSLALAAYNGGPGRVRRAIRAAGSEDISAVRRFLPGETRRYLPRMVAAAYLGAYYDRHGLEPELPKENPLNTRTLLIGQRLSFNEICAVTDLNNAAIARLNPAFRGSYVPESKKGFYLRLPKKALPAIREILAGGEGPTSPTGVPYEHVVSSGQQLHDLARVFNVTVEDILAWNRLREPEIVPGQLLMVYLGKELIFAGS